jgi:pyruvate/2-oxoglutarate dehydrogenase complex dihydrolipoamide acyltransferase (E2) component
MRKAIAKRLVAVDRSGADVLPDDRVDMTRMMELRERQRAAGEGWRQGVDQRLHHQGGGGSAGAASGGERVVGR